MIVYGMEEIFHYWRTAVTGSVRTVTSNVQSPGSASRTTRSVTAAMTAVPPMALMNTIVPVMNLLTSGIYSRDLLSTLAGNV